jgi:hypothetical protein
MYCREYFPSDTIKLINRSEGMMVRNRAQVTPVQANEPTHNAAHAIGRHLLQNAPGSLGLGVAAGAFADRFLSDPLDSNGQPRLSSAWSGKGEMAIMLCELLNSDIGQLALASMDRGVRRAFIHSLNQGKLAGLLHGSTTFKESKINVTPPQTVLVERTFQTSKGPITRSIRQNVPGSKASQVTAQQIASVNAVIDVYRGGLHIQTLYPSSDMSASFCEWFIGGVKVLSTIDTNGKTLQKTIAA